MVFVDRQHCRDRGHPVREGRAAALREAFLAMPGPDWLAGAPGPGRG
ncbi:MAG TPA: hypothetical protein VE684_05980 [Crenalkalicoccus sp.]|nr:hypothetical protein [Crenalkalicoccus sp.]